MPPKTPRAKALRNLAFLQRRHAITGMDLDYVGPDTKLTDAELAWLEQFGRTYYDGAAEGQSLEHKKEANHRRYSAKCSDAMGRRSGKPLEQHRLSTEDSGDLNPEQALLLKEAQGEQNRRKRERRGGE